MRSAPLILVGLGVLLGGAALWLFAGPSPGPLEKPSADGPLAMGTPSPTAAPTSLGPVQQPKPDPMARPDQIQASRQQVASSKQLPLAEPKDWRQTFGDAEASFPAQTKDTFRVVGKLFLDLKAAPGMAISLTTDDKPNGATVTSEKDGSFVIETTKKDGDTAVLITGPKVFPRLVHVEWQRDERVNLGHINLDRSKAMVGLLIGDEDDPVPGDWVKVSSTHTPLYTLNGSVGFDARFELPKVPPSGWIFAGGAGYQLTTLRLPLPPTEDGTLPQIQLTKGLHQTVFVTDAAGEPIPQVRIQLVNERDIRHQPLSMASAGQQSLYKHFPGTLNATTNHMGLVEFNELSSESYRILVETADFITPLSIRLPARSSNQVTIALEPKPTLWVAAQVLDKESGDHVPARGAQLFIQSGDSRPWMPLKVEQDGTSELLLDQSGTWRLCAIAPGYQPYFDHVIFRASPSAPPQKLTLKPRPWMPAELQILDPKGEPISTATLQGKLSIDTDSRQTLDVHIDAEPSAPGTFRLPAPGFNESIEWTAAAPGLLAGTTVRDIKDMQQEELESLQLQPSYAARIKVTTQDGQPIADTVITVRSLNFSNGRIQNGHPLSVFKLRTNELGSMLYDNLEAGKHTLILRGPYGHLSGRATVEVGPGHSGITTATIR